MLYKMAFQAPSSVSLVMCRTVRRSVGPVLSVPCQSPAMSCAYRMLPIASAPINNFLLICDHLVRILFGSLYGQLETDSEIITVPAPNEGRASGRMPCNATHS